MLAEILKVIYRIKIKKAPGSDGISNCALKYCKKNILLYISQIFNGCARQEYFPGPWKTAEIIMLPKIGKDPKTPINHCPISFPTPCPKISNVFYSSA